MKSKIIYPDFKAVEEVPEVRIENGVVTLLPLTLPINFHFLLQGVLRFTQNSISLDESQLLCVKMINYTIAKYNRLPFYELEGSNIADFMMQIFNFTHQYNFETGEFVRTSRLGFMTLTCKNEGDIAYSIGLCKYILEELRKQQYTSNLYFKRASIILTEILEDLEYGNPLGSEI